MRKLDPKTDGATADIVVRNIEKLKALFPDVVTEGKVDFDVLRETLGEYEDDRPERYNFTWHGKSRARRIAQTPSTGTLRPCPEESVDWDTTKNLFIEGDNLEVLKLLQKSYHRKIKMIYIDPPYNTGGEFIYPDKFADNLGTYLRYTGQVDDEGFKLSANSETSGRYHTNWLNMMYPRLKLARNLLSDDGVIFISIDDCELANLRKLCDEVFGEENFVGNIVWQKTYSPANDKKGIDAMHDNILCYRKTPLFVCNLLTRTEQQDRAYSNPDSDPRGPWKAADSTRAEHRDYAWYPIVTPSGREVWPARGRSWVFTKEDLPLLIEDNRLWFGKDGNAKPSVKKFLSEVKSGVVATTWWNHETGGHNDAAKKELKSLLADLVVFQTPKPTKLVSRMMLLATGMDGHILDFFAGSCTTAHSVFDLNKKDNGRRKFIMVQLPEPCGGKSHVHISRYKTIADIGKERIRRVIEKIKNEQEEKAKEADEKLPGAGEDVPQLDLGFKVFKLDSSNIIPWDADFDNLEEKLYDAVVNVKGDRTEADVLHELLLKYGLDLTVPIKEREIGGKTVSIIGFGALIVCLAENITLDVVEGIAALKDELKPEKGMRVVFKDAGFEDDVLKTNAVQILKQAGIEDVKSL